MSCWIHHVDTHCLSVVRVVNIGIAARVECALIFKMVALHHPWVSVDVGRLPSQIRLAVQTSQPLFSSRSFLVIPIAAIIDIGRNGIVWLRSCLFIRLVVLRPRRRGLATTLGGCLGSSLLSEIFTGGLASLLPFPLVFTAEPKFCAC